MAEIIIPDEFQAIKTRLENIIKKVIGENTDSSLSSSSTNPVQNNVIKSALDDKSDNGHSHIINDVADLQTTLNTKQDSLTDTGWIDGSTFMNTHMPSYDSNHPIRIRKIHKIVHFEGIAKNDNNLGGDTNGTLIGTVPTEFRPSNHQYSLQQGSGKNFFLLHIYTNGQIWLERYGTTSMITVPNGSWLHLNMTWFVD